MTTLVSLENVSVSFGQRRVLSDVSLNLKPGKILTLLGPNGAGKSTLVRVVLGLVAPDAGVIVRQDKLRIGYVPQDKRIFSQLSVEENLHIALAAGKPGANASGGEIYEHFPELYALRQRKGASLSDDDQYQLALARALIVQPRLLILDEPSRGRGPRCLQKLADLLLRLNRDIGLTVLLAEQHLPFIRRVADRFCVLHRGRNVAEGDIMALDEPLLAQWITPDPAP